MELTGYPVIENIKYYWGLHVFRLWTNLSPHRRGEVTGVGIITLGLVIFLGLVSYQSADFERSDGQIENWIGLPGAWLAKLAFGALGWTAFLVPLLLLYWGFRRIRLQEFSSSLLPLSGTFILILSLCTLLSIWFSGSSEKMVQAGGIIGAYAAARMVVFGPVGSYLILLALVAISLLLSTDILFTPMIVRMWEGITNRWKERRARRRKIRTNLETLIEERPKKKGKKKKLAGEDEEPIEIPLSEGDEEDDEKIFPLILTAQESNKRKKNHKCPPAPRHLENYKLPPLSLFNRTKGGGETLSSSEILHNSETLERTLSEFGIAAKVVEVNHGPVITRYELEPPPGIKINRIVGLADDLALALRASHVRIIAPIPGKAAVGVEIPNRHRSEVFIRDVFSSDCYMGNSSLLKIALGKTISGEAFTADLATMPHLLIAGATGSGKSVCVNSIIASILVNAAPDEVKFLMIDPKRVELKMYSDIPHMIAPVVTDAKRAASALRWIVEEMEDRYRHLSRARVRDIYEFNQKQKEALTGDLEKANPSLPSRIPYIIVIIDELADLMMIARGEIEAAVARLAQMARAVGIHIIIATQRPSVDIITGADQSQLSHPNRFSSLYQSRFPDHP